MVASSLRKSNLMRFKNCRLAVSRPKKFATSLWIKKSWQINQLVSSLLTTCRRLVIIVPEQATRTYPDIKETSRQQTCRNLHVFHCVPIKIFTPYHNRIWTYLADQSRVPEHYSIDKRLLLLTLVASYSWMQGKEKYEVISISTLF